ncbi:amino acid permease [Ectobacillus sp. JY-23]|uniref:amino acid permease n=1 Tax=Ectobacillus sp. JY-23 TaxID=2933872 RepID=UPI001FF37489|nr:amino acid permease [Ectobacillus sp. JY-23]UOY91612.1 amino acid permease [Ectobacillus sp. JY-23]
MNQFFHKKSIQEIMGNRDKGLEKTLGAFDLVLLGIGAIVGIGILVLTGMIAANYAGPSVIFSFILAAIICTFVAFCYAELASALPTSGGVYIYSYLTVGELVAFLIGWAQMLMYILAVAAVANGWSAYFVSLLNGFGVEIPKAWHTDPMQGGFANIPAIVIVLLLTWVLTQGAKESKRITNMMVMIKIIIIALFVVVGIFYVKPDNWTPFMPFGVEGIIGGAAAVFFAFLGFDAVAAAAEEVKNPKRDLPIGIIGSLVICTILYVVVSLILTGMVPFEQLDVSDAMAFALHAVGQDMVAGILSVGALAGITTVILAYLYAGVRMLFAMSRDKLLPQTFSRMDAKTNTPVFSTWLLGLLAAVLGGFVDLKALSDLVNMIALLTFIMVAISVIILRRTHTNLQRGFTAPFVPYLPVLVIVCCAYLMLKLNHLTWMYLAFWLILGAISYYLHGKFQMKLDNTLRKIG